MNKKRNISTTNTIRNTRFSCRFSYGE